LTPWNKTGLTAFICHSPAKEIALSKPQRTYAFMDRIIDIAHAEFSDLSPAEVVFSLGLLTWRYYEQIHGHATGRYSPDAMGTGDCAE
jgi:hypothetical protein